MIEKFKQSLTKGQKIKLSIAIVLLILMTWSIVQNFTKKSNVTLQQDHVEDIIQMDTSDIRPELTVRENIEPNFDLPELNQDIENKTEEIKQVASEIEKATPEEVLHLDDDATNLVHYSTQLKVQTVRQKALEAQMNADKIALEKAESEKYVSQPKLKGSYVLPPVPNEKTVNFENYKPSFIDDMRVASLVGVGDNIEAVISFQNQYIPIKVGSKIGDITITKITPNAVSFNENGKTRTKWVSSVPTPVIYEDK